VAQPTSAMDVEANFVAAAVAPSPQVMMGQGAVLGQFVTHLNFQIQRGFRRKMLGILFLQLCLTMAVGLAVRYAIPLDAFLTVAFPAQSVQTLVLGFLCIGGLPLITAVRDKHPWNLVCTTLWTVVWAVFLAASHVPGGFIRSNALFVAFGSLAVGVGALLLLSTTFSYIDHDTGERTLISFGNAGFIAYVVMIAAAIVFYSQTPHLYEAVGHFIGALIFTTGLFAWVVYESTKLCERMRPDDYMKGVIYFYTDFLFCCCCCLFAGCMTGGAG